MEQVHHQISACQHPRYSSSQPSSMKRVAAIILGGGEGTRLSPLTLNTCKPALQFGGKYRLIDIPISHAIHANCSSIYILTQFLSAPLHQHIFTTYARFSDRIALLAAEQRPMQGKWFKGSADAVRQNLRYLAAAPADYFIILAGDQLYNMDFSLLAARAMEMDVDILVAAIPVGAADVRRMGIMRMDEKGFITEFQEKPQSIDLVRHMSLAKHSNERLCAEEKYLASMGIYIIKRDALFDLLQDETIEDFGGHLIPKKVSLGSIAAYVYEGYWEDIGTVESFYKANMALLQSRPAFNCYDESLPIFSEIHHLPPPKITHTKITNSIICDGSIVEASELTQAILGPRTVIRAGSIVRNSYIMGHESCYPQSISEQDLSVLCVDERAIIEGAIIDKHVHIGKQVRLVNTKKIENYSSDHVYIRNGIIIVTRGAVLPDGFVL